MVESPKDTDMPKKKETKDFDYIGAVSQLEEIARKVESPDCSLADIDANIRRSEAIIGACRAWLRGLRERTEKTEQL